jgi:hypothetical protein
MRRLTGRRPRGRCHAGPRLPRRAHGHAHAALRYLTLSRPGPSHKPEQPIDYATAYRTYDPDEARRERAIEMDHGRVREELWF